MPLSQKARIEVYIPDIPQDSRYIGVLNALEKEFTYTFGGCTIIRGLDGSYLSQNKTIGKDRINVIYSDTNYDLNDNFEIVEEYADNLRKAVYEALTQEAILVVVYLVYHSES